MAALTIKISDKSGLVSRNSIEVAKNKRLDSHYSYEGGPSRFFPKQRYGNFIFTGGFTQPTDLDNLQSRIQQAFDEFPQEMIFRTLDFYVYLKILNLLSIVII